MTVRTIAIISTGGTIEKTYDEINGALSNEFSVLDIMLGSLQIGGVQLTRVPLMNKDSLNMTSDDHQFIAGTALAMAKDYDGVVVVHGTDRLEVTGEKICSLNGSPSCPIVLTGAMRPYELRHSDALQNLTEALMAVQLLQPGVYVAIHNKVLQFPGVHKDPTQGTFIKRED